MGDQFNEELKKEFKEVFSFFDRDSDGSIPTSELSDILKSLGQKSSEGEIEAVKSLIDPEEIGSFDFQGFLQIMVRNLKTNETPKELEEAFKVFDKDEDGFISPEELLSVMTNLGENLTEEEVEQIISESDKDEDGKINLSEFGSMMMVN